MSSTFIASLIENEIDLQDKLIAWTVQTRQGSKDRTTCSTSTGSSGLRTAVPKMACSQGPGTPCLSRGDPFQAVGVIT